jgi:hypothetical protein
MSARASCPDGARPCLPTATRGPTPDPLSQMLPGALVASFSPNRRRFWHLRAGCTQPKGPITCSPWWVSRRGPVISRAARCSSRSPHRPLEAVFVEVFAGLEQPRLLAPVRGLGAQRWVALEGPTAFASTAVPCPTCLTRPLPNGPPLSSHAALTPGSVCPGQAQGIALPPEDLRPHDGPAQHDGERAAGQRWRRPQAAPVAPQGVTCLGAAL